MLAHRANQWVERGQTIGKSGTTGCSTGPHLHFNRKRANTYTSIPTRFLDPDTVRHGGVPRGGHWYTSDNLQSFYDFLDASNSVSDPTPLWADVKLRVGSNSTFELELWAADYITNVTEVRVAATVEDLQNAPWSPYSETANSTYTWTLPLVFAQFKSAVGKESEVVSDTVEAVTYETIQASFNVNPSICAATTLSIDNSSLPLCEQCNWRWNFGNGTTSQTMEPDFNTDLSLYAGYQTPGFYTIALTATSLANTSTFTQQIEVLPAPSAEFTLERDGRTITVQAENTTAKNWLWDFGDGSTASGTSIATHTYTDTNVLDEYFVPVSLQVEGENGCTNFKFQYVPQEKWLFLPVVMRSG